MDLPDLTDPASPTLSALSRVRGFKGEEVSCAGGKLEMPDEVDADGSKRTGGGVGMAILVAGVSSGMELFIEDIFSEDFARVKPGVIGDSVGVI